MPEHRRDEAAPARAFWSGTITFGLVSIPVDLFAAVRGRRTSMRMVDTEGRPLGRRYVCPEDGETLSNDDIVRGYETEEGEIVVVTDEELRSIAPEMSREIDLRRFVPAEQIPPTHYQRPYFLAPSGRSTKAYHLLAETMERTGRVGIGTFVMRGKEYLVAILSEGGVLRAETLRFADELRTPEEVGLPDRPEVPRKRVREMAKAIDALAAGRLDVEELADQYADELLAFVEDKEERGEDVIETRSADEDDATSGEVVDLMQIIKERISVRAKVARADGSGAASGGAAQELSGLSKQELYDRAQSLDIPGRSKMNKKQLVRAIRKAS